MTRWEQAMESAVRLAYEAEEGAEYARDFSTGQRKKMASAGTALPDGSFPIADASDLANAIKAVGRAGSGKRARVMAHIKKRAKSLGREDLLPDAWK